MGSTTLKVGRNKYLNELNAEFISTTLDQNRELYCFGYKRNEKRLLNETILLPINNKNEPDYDFMEQYIKLNKLQKLNTYVAFLQQKRSN